MSSTIHASSKGLKDLPNASATIGKHRTRNHTFVLRYRAEGDIELERGVEKARV
jgi:hypothetical protein